MEFFNTESPLKRCRTNEEVAVVPRMQVAVEIPSKVQDSLADKYKLADAKEFHIQGNVNGQMLGCGVEVRKYPDNSRFRIRLYDRDRNNAGKLRTYIELSLDEFLKIKRHEKQIRSCLSYIRHDEHIFRQEDYSAIVVAPTYEHRRPALKLFKNNSRMYLYEETLVNMLSYEETMKNEYSECQRRNDEDRRLFDDLVTIMAFRRNEEKTNDFVGQAAEWFQGGTVTTWNKFVDQASKSKERLRKKVRTSDKTTR